MNKITKRIVASLSAAALIVSTFGSNSFSGTMMDSVYAEESATTSNRKGKSTGFENLEQDTNADGYYNTGYGLHTNKTASVAEGSTDGRTFDVNLESWYVGENPVDIATILDASGSMAWTVDTLEPLTIEAKDIDTKSWPDKYGVSTTGNIQTDLRTLQEKNGGYLPEEVVEQILKPENTDNSKLSYRDYRYYVYEDRSSVSEFVPLGYWDGGLADNLIGYYNLDGNLINQVNGKSAKLIKNVDPSTSGATFVDEEPDKVEVKPTYNSNGLDLYSTDNAGNIVIDISSLKEKSFEISFQLRSDAPGNVKCYDTPLIYVGDKSRKAYFSVFRGNSSGSGTGSSNHLRLKHKDIDGTENTETFNKALDSSNWNKTIDCKIIATKTDTGYTLDCTFGTVEQSHNVVLGEDDLYLILGGSELLKYGDDKTDISHNYIKNLKITTDSTTVANFPLTSDLNNTASDSTDIGNAQFVKDGEEGTFNVTDSPIVSVTVEYSSDGKSLSLNNTCKKGAAVKLDVTPSPEHYTISFDVMINNVNNTTAEGNILYVGDNNTDKYYLAFRGNASSRHHLRIKEKGEDNPICSLSNFFSGKSGEWQTVTYVVDGNSITAYKDGNNPQSGILTLEYGTDPLSIILGGLWDDKYNRDDIFVKNVYVFDKALSEGEVNRCFGSAATESCSTDKEKKSHAIQNVVDKSTGTTNKTSLAQITSGLAKNTAYYRRGWYYVNSHSDWIDISGNEGDTLESGKQYVGIAKDDGLDDYCNIDEATIPSAWKDTDLADQIKDGDADQPEYVVPEAEQSIRFYVDAVGYLRCIVYSGGESKEDNPHRTFCSVVYWKGEDSSTKSLKQTKYERLNDALNQFYSGLAEYSDLTNTAVVRYSTKSAEDSLDQLIMQNWTSWSDYYQEEKEKNPEANPDNSDFLEDLLIPKDWETSITQQPAAENKEGQEAVGETGQYPYVMTGGTYTWTGLKSFYDNMVDIDGKESGNRVYDVATDARDKYLIIFTDGRDNTQDITLNADGTGVETYGTDYNRTDNVESNNPYSDDSTHTVGDDNHEIKHDGDLAEAWADKLKEEGYTIYCVMMSTGSVSQTANAEEFGKAYYFLKTLAGSKEIDDEIADLEEQLKTEEDLTTQESLKSRIEELKEEVQAHVIVAAPTGGSNEVSDAFQTILERIQKPRTDYTVQDYIDPRFNLIGLGDDGSTITYNLGANGTITYNGITTTVGNDIGDSPAVGLAYTPMKSEMVNRKENPDYPDGYDNGDNKGTGYIYYDDEKDMYYLRWTDQIIPMRDSSFDTGSTTNYLDVWSATIRLKAKDDFIGGNDILTNGNEAGENLVFSTSTIDNMEDNYKFYGFTDEDKSSGNVTERAKLQKLSGTDRKINAVDAGGVSQAVYGDGMDIPSSGFPRVTVNVRLLKLNAKNLNDVIYMGEVVSPTMMLADLENDYMTGSYYLEYLERYAYRLYGYNATDTPLLDLLNEWLKIDDEDEAEKTFTIPYMYLPAPEYDGDTLKTTDFMGKSVVAVKNSTGMSLKDTPDPGDVYTVDFTDNNLRDITGFITYTWKRDNTENKEEPQQWREDLKYYDITQEYIAKNTRQIKYNLQLKFTPLHNEDIGVSLEGEKFIKGSTGKEDDFFMIDSDTGEFATSTDKKWEMGIRGDYLKAMVSETHIYEPHIMYDDGKWVLVDTEGETDHSLDKAIEAYTKDDSQVTLYGDSKHVQDVGVYDWDSTYKETKGEEQIVDGKLDDYYTDTPENVAISSDKHSLEANTTYTKDVVNGALALELVVDGKYLGGMDPVIEKGKKYTFTATRYYDDPYDPLPYGTSDPMNADTDVDGTDGAGQQYQLTFEVDKAGCPESIPKTPQEGEFYTVLAYLDTVEVGDSTAPSGYKSIKDLGYENTDSLPIGTYKIEVKSADMVDNTNPANNQYYIGDRGVGNQYFKYLKVDSTPSSYIYNRFPESVYSVSKTAKKSTNDSEYLIWDDSTDYAPKNIAKNKRINEAGTQTLTFYLGTVEERRINGKPLTNTIGYSGNDKSTEAVGNDYTKDRLGIMLLSADLNNLFISKEVTHTNSETEKYKTRPWKFTVTFTPNDGEESEFTSPASGGLPTFNLTWYQRTGSSAPWNKQEISTLPEDYPNGSGGTGAYPATISFSGPDSDGKYTATIYLRHNEKVLINDLPDGEWQVEEMDERSAGAQILYSAHNDMDDDTDDYSWSNKTLEWASLPGAGVQFTNQFPFYILSAGGSGTYLYILCGSLLLLMASVLYYLSRLRKSKSRDKPDG